jgi:hypothetical protein
MKCRRKTRRKRWGSTSCVARFERGKSWLVYIVMHLECFIDGRVQLENIPAYVDCNLLHPCFKQHPMGPSSFVPFISAFWFLFATHQGLRPGQHQATATEEHKAHVISHTICLSK